MSNFVAFWRGQYKQESGQALVEYSLILALVALAAIVGLTAMAGGVGGLFDTVKSLADAMQKAISG